MTLEEYERRYARQTVPPPATNTNGEKTSDPQTEAAVIAYIACDNHIAYVDEHSLKPEDFSLRHWQIAFQAAKTVLDAGQSPCTASFNAWIEKNALPEFKRSLGHDNSMPDAWRKWPEMALETCGGILSINSVRWSMDDLKRYSKNRHDHEIRLGLANHSIDWQEAAQLHEEIDNSNADSPFEDLSTTIDSDLSPEIPTIASFGPNHFLLYAGRMNEIHSEPGIGKTNLALAFVINVIESGKDVVFLDPEDNTRGILRKLAAFGADMAKIAKAFRYIENPDPDQIKAAIAWSKTHKPALAVLDGLAEALIAQSLDENNPSDVLKFFHDYLRPFADCGSAVLVSDHVSKDKDQRGQWARGTGAKMGRYDGVSYTIELISAYSPGKEGRLRLKVAKDRCGGVGASKSTVGDFIFQPLSDEQTQITFRFPEILPDGGFKPTAIMRKISDHLEVFPNSSKRDLRELGKSEYVDTAVKLLAQDGFISVTHNKPGTSMIFNLIKPFTE